MPGADLLDGTNRFSAIADLEFVFPLAEAITAVAIESIVVVNTEIGGVCTDIDCARITPSVS